MEINEFREKIRDYANIMLLLVVLAFTFGMLIKVILLH